jgi:carboxylesterase
MNSILLEDLITEKGFYYQGNNQKTVILVHGLTGLPLEMKYVGKELNKKGFTVICPLLAGHAQGKKELLKTNYNDWYQTIKDVLLAIEEKVDQIYVAGICVGGMLGLKLAYEFKHTIKGAAVYSAAIRYDGWNIPLHGVLSPLIPIIGHLPPVKWLGFSERHPFGIKDDRLRNIIMRGDFLKDSEDKFPFQTLRQMYKLNDDMRDKFKEIITPTLLLHAKNDDLSHYRNSEYILSRLGGKKQLILLDDSYHMIHIDRERAKVVEYTADFFNKS